MVDIDTLGMEVAPLSDEQLSILNEAQSHINNQEGVKQEIYLLAVTRH